MGNQRKQALVASSKTRVTGENSEQTVKSSPGILWRIVVANQGAAAGTLTVSDGETDLIVIDIPNSEAAVSIEFGIEFNTDLRVTPSVTDIDALVIYD